MEGLRSPMMISFKRLGSVNSPICMIEIERLLKVIHFDQPEIPKDLFFEVCLKMDTLIRGPRDYVMYDKFFSQLYFLFQMEDDKKKPPQNTEDFERRLRLEQALPQQFMRQVGVVNHDVNQQGEISDIFYDSILDLLKDKIDYQNYQFMGFQVTISSPITINAMYGNPKSYTKLYLSSIILTKSIRNISVSPPQKYKNKNNKVVQPSKNVNKTVPSIQISSPAIFLVQILNTLVNMVNLLCIDDLIEVNSIADFFKDEIDLDNKYTPQMANGQQITFKEETIFRDQRKYMFNYIKTFYGAAKPLCTMHLNSDSESDELDEQPLMVDMKLVEKDKIDEKLRKERAWKGNKKSVKKIQPIVQQQLCTIKQDDSMIHKLLETQEQEEVYALVKDLEIPYRSRAFEIKQTEYSMVKINEEDLIAENQEAIEIDLLQFGFATSLLLQVYSIKSDIIRAVRISFPEENLSVPLINFPHPQVHKQVYDCHIWKIAPIDNIKGIQVHKRRLPSGEEVVKNFIFIVQDNENSRLSQYDFQYLQNQQLFEERSILQQIMPTLSSNWRNGLFRIFLNYNNKISQDIVINLHRIDQIFEQMFPQMIVEVNKKQLRVNTVFEVFLQGMGRIQKRDNYDRYYFLTVSNWDRLINSFDSLTTELIDNILILIWSYGGAQNLNKQ